MKSIRTPDAALSDLSGYDFAPCYSEIPDTEGGTLRMHHLDEGPGHLPPILCLHGEPTWSYLYRKMIPVFVAAGRRVVAPDLIGFGKSDKPIKRSDYTYQRHVDWMQSWLEGLELHGITLVCQDGKQIEAHKIILVGSGAAFNSLFNMHEHAHPSLHTISLPCIRKENMR